ncbi:hypothetical protein PHSY_000868 [Pseudozyma hubeiensis SY62]|uniref:Uncharacterized protein n=1 Tax=Pseudozyma hubeiensis (strain SY62) TaxID=1305764 RepID=R9NXB5_PSEHS|nr:hypothetical protein PHSY_000868 [Pseudozyma hubeiensis SY62]GAC93303.1 hypothetical protein PHSY_000868 [Pseudozyma hubeiensis SY62]
MTTATPLSLPFVLDQRQLASASASHRRRWKPDRPNYRALITANYSKVSAEAAASSYTASRFQSASNPTAPSFDHDQLEADLQEWGLPSLPTTSKLAAPTSALSWDENSAQASCSYLQSAHSSRDSAVPASLEQWDPSISFAPYSSSALDPIDFGPRNDSSPSTKYNPGMGRVIAIGRDDGTVTLYRAYGRVEDYESLADTLHRPGVADDTLPASVSASANLSHLSPSESRRSSDISNPINLRSPDVDTPSIRLPSSSASKSIVSSSREPTSFLSTFSPVDRSPFTTRSIVSAASVSSTVATNVQIDEGLPAHSLQSNINATGHTAGRTFGEQAEDRLELQMAAAERNDHQHGVVGGVIERLGLSSHSHSQSHSHSSSPQPRSPKEHSRHQSSHRNQTSESRQSPITPPNGTRSVEALAAVSEDRPRSDAQLQASIPHSTSDAWLNDPSRGTFGELMTLYTRDRSPVVALRLVPFPSKGDDQQDTTLKSGLAPPVSDKTVLLVVQEAGFVSLWSILEGSLIWQTDVTSAYIDATDFASLDVSGSQTSASLGMIHSFSRQLPAAIGTPLTRSPAGSARASPRPAPAGSDASMRRSMLRSALSAPDASTNPRLRESHGVKLHGSVQALDFHGAPIALLWDSHSSSAMMLDLSDGRLLLHEAVDDVFATSVPKLRLAADSKEQLELCWFSETDRKLQKQSVRMLSSTGISQTQGDAISLPNPPLGFIFEGKAEATGASWTLSIDDAQADSVHISADHIVVQSRTRLSILNARDGPSMFVQEATDGHFKGICGSSRDGQHLLVQTTSGLARLRLTTTRSHLVEQHHAGAIKGKAEFSSLPGQPPSRLCLAWNLPGSGELLDKLFLIQPLSAQRPEMPAEDADASSISSDLATFDLVTSRTDDLLGPGPSRVEGAQNNHDEHGSANSITAMLPLSLERISVASWGGLRILSLSSIAAGVPSGPERAGNDRPKPIYGGSNSLGTDHKICLLRSAVAPRSGQRLIIGGTMQGEVGFWHANVATAQDGASTSFPPLEAKLSVSTTPVEALVVFGDEDNTIRLHGCVACICADSSVSIILLEGFRLMYTIPGRGARLTSLASRADELLLTYDDDKARVWDLRSQELRRSIATDQAQALIEDGKGWWTVKTVEPYSPLHSGTTGVLSQLASARDGAAASLLVDFRRAIEAAARAVRGSGQAVAKEDLSQAAARSGQPSGASPQPALTMRTEPDFERTEGQTSVGLGSPAARKAVNIIRPLLPTVFPSGLDVDVDAKLAALLDLEEQSASAFGVGLHSAPDGLVVSGTDGKGAAAADTKAKQAWKLSSRLTTTRLIVASALLQVLSHISELSGLATALQDFVQDEAQLSTLVGVGFRGVRLEELVPYWLDSNSELQTACRAMFAAALARLEQTELDEVCSQWQGWLTSAKNAALQTAKSPLEGRQGPNSVEGSELRTRALALVGSIAVERYTSLSPRLLKDVASTIHGAIVSDRGSEMRTPQDLQMLAVAIELCRSGFSVWQHYFDATEVVRSLFALSTSTSSSTSSTSKADGDLRTLARAATLQIAADNTPLFMTTLSLDILHARSPAHCSATMRLVAFMVRKRPSVLVANLPRLAEAVVKSLDPTHTTMREAVVNAATVMISELVSTYPSVSFFGGGQRLAVGTHEGAVIVYDLKTATRLYVLEGHRRRADAVSFSPDGRRLVTVSLEEGRVLIWKTSSGFSSFFSPGQMPRQGATDAKLTDGAYRAFLFNVGDHQQKGRVETNREGQLGEEQDFVGFDRIGFQWNSDRSVKVQIGEAQLNISVE